MSRSKLSPVLQNISWDRVSTPPTIFSLFATIIEDTEIDYVQYYFQFENTSVNWLVSPGSNTSYLEIVDSQATLPLVLQNTNFLYPGTYKATVFFELSNSIGYQKTLSSTINLTLTGNPPDSITTDKSIYNLVYNRDSNVLSGETIVNIINNNTPVKFETIGTLFAEGNFTDSIQLIEDVLHPFSTNEELPEFGVKKVNAILRKDGQAVWNFIISISVIGDSEILVNPTSYDIVLRKGFNEVFSDVLSVINPLNIPFSIVTPDWLNLSATSGSASVDLTLTSVNSDTFEVGLYNENIVLTYSNKTIIIPVKLEVKSFVDIDVKDYNFCLDKVILKANKMNASAAFIKVNLRAKFVTSEGEIITNTSYQIPYFNNWASLNVGEKIQNQFPIWGGNLLRPINNFDNQLIYKPAAVLIEVIELDINHQTLHEITLNEIELFAGHRPKCFPIFTDINFRRKYNHAAHIFSYYSGLVSPELISNDFQGANPSGNNEVQSVLLQGEINKSSLKTNFDISLIDFPKGENQYVLQWLNKNLVPEVLVISGNVKIDKDYEHTYDNFSMNGKKYDTKNVVRIIAATGFLLKEEFQLLDSINQSLLCYIMIEDVIYRCFPITKKLPLLNTDQNLFQSDLEFFAVL